MKTFSIKEALRFGWQKFQEHIWFLIGLFIINFLLSFPLGKEGVEYLKHAGIDKNTIIGLSAIAGIATFILQIGLMRVVLKIIDGITPTLADIFPSFSLIIKYIGTMILYALIVLGGIILLIVPGIIWAIKYSQVFYLVIDKHTGIIPAFKESGKITDGVKGKLIAFGLVFGLMNLAGALAYQVGVIITGPIALLASVYVYRKLHNLTFSVSPVTPEFPPENSPTTTSQI